MSQLVMRWLTFLLTDLVDLVSLVEVLNILKLNQVFRQHQRVIGNKPELELWIFLHMPEDGDLELLVRY